MNLSKHLSLKEVTKSLTSLRRGIENIPTDEHLHNLIVLAEMIFEPIRVHFNVPIGVSSGYRSYALNKVIGGSKTSQHSKGEALDLDADIFGKITNKQIFDFIKENLIFDQLVFEFGSDEEPDWVHVSYTEKSVNRKQVLRSKKINGKTVYIRI